LKGWGHPVINSLTIPNFHGIEAVSENSSLKLWGSRFVKATDSLLEKYNASIGFDWRLFAADIKGSIAYAQALVKAGILTSQEAQKIIEGLNVVRVEFEEEQFTITPDDEDIHTAVERRLHELIGDVAGKLHTGRSRNDQIATDIRLYLMAVIPEMRQYLKELQQALVTQAESNIDIIMPGYTHLQPAQPILYSHWAMAFFWKLQRDVKRLDDLEKRVAVLPLGSGPLAGNAFGIDREMLAENLGFTSITENSLDGVADRDFIAEFLFWAAMVQVHLSSLAEDIIIYASAEFGFIELDDAYSTGSSIMPQKKNPDPLELARGKTGRVIGDLVSLLTTLKALPTAYDKDLQEDKEPLFDVIDTLEIELPVITGVIRTLRVNASRMQDALVDEMLATDLADYLVRKGLPFRQGHHIVGHVVRAAIAQGCSLRELPLETYQAISPLFSADIAEVLDFRYSVEQRNVPGGTATSSVLAQVEKAKGILGTG
jgi:argininosuccinate lyase